MVGKSSSHPLQLAVIITAALLSIGLHPAARARAQELQAQPEIDRSSLLNGLQLLLVEKPQAKASSIALVIRYGALYDPLGKEGLARLTGEMLLKGSKSLSAAQLAAQLQSLGAKLEAVVDWDGTYIFGSAPPGRAEALIEILSNLLLEPAFAPEDFGVLRQRRLAELERREKNHAELADLWVERLLFAGTSLGRSKSGTIESLNAVSLSDLKDFYERFYLPNAASLIVVGDFDNEKVRRTSARRLGRWVKGDPPPFSFLPPRLPETFKINLLDMPEAGESQIRLGMIGVRRGDEDYAPLEIASLILSQDQASGLGAKLAAGPGFAYNASARFEGGRLGGPFIVSASTAHERAADLLENAIQSIHIFAERGPEAGELERAKRALIAQFRARATTPEGLASLLAEIELYQLGMTYLTWYERQLARVSVEDIRRVAARYLRPERGVAVVVGSASSIGEELNAVGPVAQITEAK